MDEELYSQCAPHVPTIHVLDSEEGSDNLGDSQHDTSSNPTIGTKPSKKQTSKAWDYFDKIEVSGVVKAKCKYCKVVLSAGSVTGTSHLLKHAKKVCSGRHLVLASGQTQLKLKTEVDGSSTLEFKSKDKEKEFNHDSSRKELINMVVMHEYPLSIVDHIGFRRFIHSLNRSFKIISRNTLKSDILKRYNEDKKSLKALLAHNGSRISITTDIWPGLFLIKRRAIWS